MDSLTTESDKEPAISKGKVLWFDKSKGYGFIAADDGCDVFIHHSAVSNSVAKALKSGVEVAFDINKGERGLTAGNVSIVE